MSPIVDDTSSLTSLPATSPSQPPGQQQSQASRSPAPSFSPSLSPRPGPRPRRGDEAAGASGSATTQGGKRKREKTSWIWTHGQEVDVDGADYWRCSLCLNRAEPKQYKVSAGTRAPATHLKEKHGVEEEINRKARRLEERKANIEQAVETTQRIQKRKAVGIIEAPGEGKSSGPSSLEWNEDVHKALLVSVSSSTGGGPRWIWIRARLGRWSPGDIFSDAHEWASRARVESSVVGEGGALASGGQWRRVVSRTVAQRKTGGVKGRVYSRTVEARSSVARRFRGKKILARSSAAARILDSCASLDILEAVEGLKSFNRRRRL
jgi:hypothetical protein